jgi:hypothetical protein
MLIDQDQSQRFKRQEFVEFYETLVSESGCGAWQADRMARWDSEDFRLFVACLLFKGLRKSEHSKGVFTWQRESADIAPDVPKGGNQNSTSRSEARS